MDALQQQKWIIAMVIYGNEYVVWIDEYLEPAEWDTRSFEFSATPLRVVD